MRVPYIETDPVGTGLVPVGGLGVRIVSTDGVYIWVVGVAPDPDILAGGLGLRGEPEYL